MIIEYGTNNSRTKTYPAGTSLATVLQDNRAVLGYGDNVEGHVGGVPQVPSLIVSDTMHVKVYDKACAKQRS